ncbi:glycosyltransferase [Leucobacter sp. W1478]|uniref:glycosyltransferase n=1 Tax=Leucobacter sp. W1478 TaxID=3439065 RepID=UPI003F3E4335
MATLTLIGEPIPGLESAVHAAAARDLTEALARVAPRGCSARLLLAHGSALPEFSSARARVETLPMRANLLPILWRTGATARPLDDEFVHAVTPLVPLRARHAEDATQTSVTVPHALAWLAPELMGTSEARQYRAYVKRALRFADAVLTPTHAVAAVLHEHYGLDLPVQVLPLAAPTAFARPLDATTASARRTELGLPERYVVTTAGPGPRGRLAWILDAMAADPALPDLVILQSAPYSSGHGAASHRSAPAGTDGAGAAGTSSPPKGDSGSGSTSKSAPAADSPVLALHEGLQGRVHQVQVTELADMGAVLSGALLLALPQEFIGTGYEVLGALDAGVSVLHSECPVASELALDAGTTADSAGSFAHELARLTSCDAVERDILRVRAEDRSRSFSWATTAWQLWELHAAL